MTTSSIELWQGGTSRLEQMLSPTLRRFLAVGAISYLVNQSVLLVLYDFVLAGSSTTTAAGLLRFDPVLAVASVIALETSVVVRFALNDRWTFRDRSTLSLTRRFYWFQVSSLGSPVIALLTVNVLTPQFGISYLMSNSIGILLGLSLNWYCSNCLVWRQSAGLRT